MFLRILGACLLALLLASGPALAEKKKTVRLVYVEWPCAVVTHYIAKVAIEEKLGRPVELMPVSVPLMFQALATGEADATLAGWLPETHGPYLKKLGDRLEDLGPLLTGARMAWVVPDYVPYKTMEELRGKAREFKGVIYGIEPGAMYMESSEKAIEAYGLEGFSLVASSDAVMVSMLAEAIRKKEYIVVTGWAPHWKFGKWDLHFLEDSQNMFGKAEGIHAIARSKLKQDMPEVYALLDNFYFTDPAQLQKLMAENMEKGADPLKNAKKFIDNNPEQVNSWLRPGGSESK